MNEHFTATETLRRLRLLAADFRRACGLPKNARVEVGLRTVPVVLPELPLDKNDAVDEHDDLADFDTFAWAKRNAEVSAHGAVVHLYVYRGVGYDEELFDADVFWMGTPTEQPQHIGRYH